MKGRKNEKYKFKENTALMITFLYYSKSKILWSISWWKYIHITTSELYWHQNNKLMHYLDQWTTRKLGNNSFYADWEISLTYDKNGNLLTNLTEGYDCIND